MRVSLLCFIIALPLSLLGADGTLWQYTATTPPQQANFEFVQSPLLGRLMFKLNRLTGGVHQLVRVPTGGLAWELMEISDPPQILKYTGPRFQIFASGVLARNTFLLDALTGDTWIAVTSKSGSDCWERVWPIA